MTTSFIIIGIGSLANFDCTPGQLITPTLWFWTAASNWMLLKSKATSSHLPLYTWPNWPAPNRSRSTMDDRGISHWSFVLKDRSANIGTGRWQGDRRQQQRPSGIPATQGIATVAYSLSRKKIICELGESFFLFSAKDNSARDQRFWLKIQRHGSSQAGKAKE